ncbi:hypothetical protein ACHAXR_003978 [Thalassiosira sp. AJA248-18]
MLGKAHCVDATEQSAHNGHEESNNDETRSRHEVLTLVLTIEYNGFQYAGFQRQSATKPPRNNNHSDGINAPAAVAAVTKSCDDEKGASPSMPSSSNGSDVSRKRKQHPHSQQESTYSTKKAKKNTPTPITVQQQIETALQKWTNLSIATLRVRGAGRTDKGVHASGQVVAFDVPLRLLNNFDNGDDIDGDNGDTINSNNAGNGNNGNIYEEHKETLSQHSIQHLRDAYNTLTVHRTKMDENGNGNETINDTKMLVDQWQIRRAITTRLPTDVVLRSVRIWTGRHSFEPRKEIGCKTYIYKLRFRCISYHDNMKLSSSSAAAAIDDTQQHQNYVNEEQLKIHPICNAGPHILRRIDDHNTVWLCPWSLDPTLMRRACNAFVGRHDFVNFVHKAERKKTNKQQTGESIHHVSGTAEKKKSPHEIDLLEFKVGMSQPEKEEDSSSTLIIPPVINATFTLRAKGFHRSMVRNLVGFVVDVARGLRSVDDIPALLLTAKEITPEDGCSISNKSRGELLLASMVNSAPACGLCLAKVDYEQDNFL